MKKIMNLLLLAALATGKAYAQMPDPDTTARHFIIMASIGNLQEINAGKLAGQKATRVDVRSFGKMMVADHSRAEEKLMQLAKARGFDIPLAATETQPTDMHLAKASGDDFDRMYIHNTVPGHRSTVMMFEEYGINGKDPEVKAYAQQMLPILKEHLAAIKALDEKYKNLTAK